MTRTGRAVPIEVIKIGDTIRLPADGLPVVAIEIDHRRSGEVMVTVQPPSPTRGPVITFHRGEPVYRL